jgi:hypothetical protein
MSLLASIFSDSFIILSRYFTLVYVFFLFLLLIGFLLPRQAEPSLDPAWIALAVVVVLIGMAFLAGWFSMITKACLNFLVGKNRITTEEEPDPALPLMESFALFREFFPGIGTHFISFAIGGFLNLGVLAAILYFVQDATASMGPSIDLMEKLARMDLPQREAEMRAMSFAQLEALSRLSLIIMGGVIGYGVFVLLTMFWPAFVILHQQNVFKAYWQSILQFFRDPFRVIAIGLFFVLGHVLPLLLFAGGSVFLLVMCQFLLMLLEIYTVVVLFVYVLHRIGKPAEVTDTGNTPADKPAA